MRGERGEERQIFRLPSPRKRETRGPKHPGLEWPDDAAVKRRTRPQSMSTSLRVSASLHSASKSWVSSCYPNVRRGPSWRPCLASLSASPKPPFVPSSSEYPRLLPFDPLLTNRFRFRPSTCLDAPVQELVARNSGHRFKFLSPARSSLEFGWRSPGTKHLKRS